MDVKRKNLKTGVVEIVQVEPSPEDVQALVDEQAIEQDIRDEQKDTPMMRAFEKTIKKNFKKHKRGNLSGTLTLNDVFAQMLVDYPELGGE